MLVSSCHTSAQNFPMSSQLNQHKMQVLAMACEIWFSAALLISCPATLLEHPTPGTWTSLCLLISNMLVPPSLALLFPLLGMLFPRSFIHPTVQFIQVSVQMAIAFNNLTLYTPIHLLILYFPF